MKKNNIVFLLLMLSGISGLGQSLLTVEDAIGMAMKQNYDILISHTAARINSANNTAGNAGMLPDIELNASNLFSLNNVSSDLSSGNKITSTDANSNSFSTSVGLNWTLFDGGKMFITKKKLDEIQTLGEIQFKDKVMQTLYQVILAYYEVVRQKQQLTSINEVIRYNKERVNILQASFNAGLVPKTDLLQSQVDLNVFLEDAIVQQTVILNSKRTLNQWLCRNADVPFEVVDSIELNYIPDSADLNKKIFSQNTQILSYQKQVDVSSLAIREFSAQRYPWLSLSAGYNFQLSNNTASTVLKNRTFGPQIGGSFNLPIFYGGSISRQVRVARLQLQSDQFGLENIKTAVNTQLQNALSDYQHAIQLLSLEKNNTLLARENLTIAMHRLRLGQTTALEVRQAEESYIQSLTRNIQFAYTAKVAETKLKQLISAL
ncbi:MAG: TolC family protein [Bacteroidales bacterium]|nr:TolC family protein [Bacteroidales bacterium]